METAPVSLRAYAILLRTNVNFRRLWFAQLISEIGDWLYTVAIYSLILEVTGSAQAVALAFVLQVFPQFFAAPTAGVMNDRLSRKRLMIIADWARAAITLTMLFAQTREAFPFLYTLLFLETIFWALFEPARTAVIPNITTSSKETLVANALSSTTWSFTLAAGSAIGGILAASFGRNTVFVLNALSFAASALILRRMHFEEPHLADVPRFRFRHLFDFTPIAEGILYVRRDARLFATMFVKCGLGLMGTNWILLPIFGERIFPLQIGGMDSKSAGMLSMSLLMGSRGVGALIGPFIASYWTGHSERNFRTGIAIAFLVGSLGYFLLGFAPSLALACACVIIAHTGGATAWVFSTTLLQLQTEDKFRGRVFSAEFAFSMLTLAIVSYSAGFLSDRGVSVRSLAHITAVLVLIPGIGWALAQRLWRNEGRSS
jgi:MFS family permease